MRRPAGAALIAMAGAAGAETAELSPRWGFVADTVMGGESVGAVSIGTVRGRRAARLMGRVSLKNDGGFVQMAFDVAPDDRPGDWAGIAFDAVGNGATYDVRLRTDDLSRPWQSYRAPFVAGADWATVQLPFAALEANRTDVPFDPSRLRRVGVVAVGREMEADVAVANIRFFR